MNWTAPTLVAINMDAEIGSYQEDGDPMREPPFTSDGSSAEMSGPRTPDAAKMVNPASG